MRLHRLCSLGLGENQVNLKPPIGSRISVTTDGAHSLIVVPHGNGGLMRYYVGLFLLVWFGMWFVGFSSAVSELSSGEARASRVFLLVVWTLAAVYAVYTTYRAFRAGPGSLRLMPNV